MVVCIVDIWFDRVLDFDLFLEWFGYFFGFIIFYGWNFVVIIIFVNVLIVLFGFVYFDVIDNEMDEYLVFFVYKIIDLICVLDLYVYFVLFNFIEVFLIVLFEWV